jgi:hypothetical protein
MMKGGPQDDPSAHQLKNASDIKGKYDMSGRGQTGVTWSKMGWMPGTQSLARFFLEPPPARPHARARVATGALS